MNCACGLPLHYNNPDIQKIIEKMVLEQGEFVEVSVEEKRYKVQRHFIALHGIKAFELEDLVSNGIVERI